MSTQNLKPHFKPYQPKEGEDYLVQGIKLKDGGMKCGLIESYNL